MATSIRLIGFFTLIILVCGCKGTSKLSVSIQGQGQVVSPAGIECGLGKNTCEMTVSDSVTLTPMATIPTPPRVSSANSYTSTIVYVYWTSSIDDVTPAQELQYRLYISRQKDNLVNAANLVAEVRGDSTGVYEREIDVSSMLASDSSNRLVQVAIVAIDGDGNEGQVSYLYDIAMMPEDIQIRTDIGFHFADLPPPQNHLHPGLRR